MAMPLWPHLRNVRLVAEQRIGGDLAAGGDGAETRGQRLAGEALEVGLGVERLEMARAAVHEQVDDARAFAGKCPGRLRPGGPGRSAGGFLLQEPAECQPKPPPPAAAGHDGSAVHVPGFVSVAASASG